MSGHDIAAAVRAELAVPGRYHLQPAAVQARASWWQVIGSWIADRWSDFWRHVPHPHVGPHAASIAGDAIVVACVLIVAIAAARLLTSLQIAREQRAALSALGGPVRSAHALFMSATASAANGAYAEAVRFLFVAAIVLLDLRGVIADEESATIKELRQALRERDSGAEAPFVEIARAYTDAAYAERPVDVFRWESAKLAYQTLVERARA